MDDERQPGKYVGVAKFAAGSAVVLLVSLGLCGLSLSHLQSQPMQDLGFVGLLGFFVGVIGLLASVLAAVIVFFRKD